MDGIELDGDPSQPSGPGGTRFVVLGAVAVTTLLAWAFLVDMAATMYRAPALDGLACASGLGALLSDPATCRMGAMAMPVTVGSVAMLAAMWIMMMVAMMLPTAVPTLLAHADIAHAARAKGEASSPTWVFAAGYLLIWGGFGVALAGVQMGLGAAALAPGMKAALTPGVAVAVLAVAAFYQLSPQKDVCLTHCRSPLTFFLQHWRPRASGALAMGIHHGAFCIGCCWALMILMFVGGTMNVALMAALTVVMGAEKMMRGVWPSRTLALACFAGAFAMLAVAWSG